jgi:disulfide bond formation protein DsbB
MIVRPERLAHIIKAALAASILSLGVAYTAQFGFGLKPCHLCLYQRVPFAGVIALALLGLWKPRLRTWLILIIGTAFLINSGIAAYHFGVEKEWVPGPTSCTSGEAPPNQSDDDFLKRIQSAPLVSCDHPQWEYHGVTMAGLNAAWCLFLAIATFAALQHSRRKQAAHA